ncbi:hypothetical protein C8R45DRAFT_965168 [Mycena sanguinolenta]|nr:hypothetical protein C8R45DRAFT_965168 [Mycena sanguinolenta]
MEAYWRHTKRVNNAGLCLVGVVLLHAAVYCQCFVGGDDGRPRCTSPRPALRSLRSPRTRISAFFKGTSPSAPLHTNAPSASTHTHVHGHEHTLQDAHGRGYTAPAVNVTSSHGRSSAGCLHLFLC